MSKDKVIKIVLGVSALLLLGFFILFNEQEERYNWGINLKYQSKSPYGSYMIYELLKSRAGKNFAVLQSSLDSIAKDSNLINSNYVFIGNNCYHDASDAETLHEFVKRGNNAFLITRSAFGMGEFFTKTYFVDSLADIEITNDVEEQQVRKHFKFLVDWKTESMSWNYFDSTLTETSYEVLGEYIRNKERPACYIKMKYGKGYYYFHCAPLSLSNFYLQNEQGLDYANAVFADLTDGKLFWDQFSHSPYQYKNPQSKSPLSFILGQPALKWAWYILLAMTLVYMLLYTKRRQSAIPILPKVTNTSIEFVETIGSLYYQNEGNVKIALHKYRLFLAHIRLRYAISTKNTDQVFLDKVSMKSGVAAEKIEKIIKKGKEIEFIKEVSDKDLIAFHHLLANYYKTCK